VELLKSFRACFENGSGKGHLAKKDATLAGLMGMPFG
jgi:hypothetical protein